MRNLLALAALELLLSSGAIAAVSPNQALPAPNDCVSVTEVDRRMEASRLSYGVGGSTFSVTAPDGALTVVWTFDGSATAMQGSFRGGCMTTIIDIPTPLPTIVLMMPD